MVLTTLEGRLSYPHSRDEEPVLERLDHLPEVIQLEVQLVFQLRLSPKAVLSLSDPTSAREHRLYLSSVRANGPSGERAQAQPHPSLPLHCSPSALLSLLCLQSIRLPASRPREWCSPAKVNPELSHSTCSSPISTTHLATGEERGRQERRGEEQQPSLGTGITGCPFPLTCPPPLALSGFPSPFQQHRKLC